MTQFARHLATTHLEVRDVTRPRSFFEVKRTLFWSFGAPLARLFSQARQLGVRTLIIEKLPDEGELLEETEDVTRRFKGQRPETHVWRLSFFADRLISSPQPGEGDFLGYAILREDWWHLGPDDDHKSARVYESVMARLDRGHNYVRDVPRWQVRCGEAFFEVEGHLFAEQNNLTNVCAHAALRCVCARGERGPELSYRRINELLGIDHELKQVGRLANNGSVDWGLNEQDMKTVLDDLGLRQVTHFYGHVGVGKSIGFDASRQRPPYPYQRALYACIESGYPALLVFGRVVTKKKVEGKEDLDLDPSDTIFHTIPIFGHTFNQDMWVPRAETTWFGIRLGESQDYLSSDLWLSAFIGHDDNLGSNYCIPKHYLPPLLLEQRPGELPRENGVMAVIQALPAAVKRDPIDAENQGHYALARLFDPDISWLYRTLARSSMPWFHHIRQELDSGRLILRPLLINANSYHDHMLALRGWSDSAVDPVRISDAWLKATHTIGGAGEKFFWMIEFSVMELFPANLRKLGEVIVLASDERSARDAPLCIAAIRLPGAGLIHINEGWDAHAWERIETGVPDHTRVLGAEYRDYENGLPE